LEEIEWLLALVQLGLIDPVLAPLAVRIEYAVQVTNLEQTAFAKEAKVSTGALSKYLAGDGPKGTPDEWAHPVYGTLAKVAHRAGHGMYLPWLALGTARLPAWDDLLTRFVWTTQSVGGGKSISKYLPDFMMRLVDAEPRQTFKLYDAQACILMCLRHQAPLMTGQQNMEKTVEDALALPGLLAFLRGESYLRWFPDLFDRAWFVYGSVTPPPGVQCRMDVLTQVIGGNVAEAKVTVPGHVFAVLRQLVDRHPGEVPATIHAALDQVDIRTSTSRRSRGSRGKPAVQRLIGKPFHGLMPSSLRLQPLAGLRQERATVVAEVLTDLGFRQRQQAHPAKIPPDRPRQPNRVSGDYGASGSYRSGF
jgi:hypothetical protein